MHRCRVSLCCFFCECYTGIKNLRRNWDIKFYNTRKTRRPSGILKMCHVTHLLAWTYRSCIVTVVAHFCFNVTALCILIVLFRLCCIVIFFATLHWFSPTVDRRSWIAWLANWQSDRRQCTMQAGTSTTIVSAELLAYVNVFRNRSTVDALIKVILGFYTSPKFWIPRRSLLHRSRQSFPLTASWRPNLSNRRCAPLTRLRLTTYVVLALFNLLDG